MGWEVWQEESAEHASHLIQKTVLSQGLKRNSHPLILHSDNVSPMKGATMLHTLHELGINPSRSRPRVSNSDPYSESMFRTCKNRPEYPLKGFVTLAESRNWCLDFVRWYRFEHHHSGIDYVTPQQVHAGGEDKVLEKRRQIYELVRAKNPLQWSRSIRDWPPPKEVWLNPEKNSEHDLRQLSRQPPHRLCQLEVSEWTSTFENPIIVSSHVDGLTFRSHVLNMNGTSYLSEHIHSG